MNMLKIISSTLSVALFSGCTAMQGMDGAYGPGLTASGRSTEYEQYAEVGVQFTSVGDFVALVSPTRWKSPLKTGGSLSWINPAAWSDDAGRTGRILLGEAVIVGGAVAAASAGGGGGSGGSNSGSTGGGTGTTPPPPPPPPPLPSS